MNQVLYHAWGNEEWNTWTSLRCFSSDFRISRNLRDLQGFRCLRGWSVQVLLRFNADHLGSFAGSRRASCQLTWILRIITMFFIKGKWFWEKNRREVFQNLWSCNELEWTLHDILHGNEAEGALQDVQLWDRKRAETRHAAGTTGADIAFLRACAQIVLKSFWVFVCSFLVSDAMLGINVWLQEHFAIPYPSNAAQLLRHRWTHFCRWKPSPRPWNKEQQIWSCQCRSWWWGKTLKRGPAQWCTSLKQHT